MRLEVRVIEFQGRTGKCALNRWTDGTNGFVFTACTFLFTFTSRSQISAEWKLNGLLLWVNWQQREANHSSQSATEVKNTFSQSDA
jgi:hypothetical protein